MTTKEKLGFKKEDEFKLEVAVDNFLNSKQNEGRERNYFYVSEIGQSKKEIYDKIVNCKPFVCDARVKRILDNGNFVHERFQKLFAEMGIHVASEIDVGSDLIHGRLDSIITDGEQNYIVEIKSCSMWTFNKLIEPSRSHMIQIQFYMYYMNIPRGFVFYENKDNNSIKSFPVTLDKELVEKHIGELEKLKEMIDKKIEPTTQSLTLETLEYKS